VRTLILTLNVDMDAFWTVRKGPTSLAEKRFEAIAHHHHVAFFGDDGHLGWSHDRKGTSERKHSRKACHRGCLQRSDATRKTVEVSLCGGRVVRPSMDLDDVPDKVFVLGERSSEGEHLGRSAGGANDLREDDGGPNGFRRGLKTVIRPWRGGHVKCIEIMSRIRFKFLKSL
jgi:hypothetical protein